jgi:hypothetical protein
VLSSCSGGTHKPSGAEATEGLCVAHRLVGSNSCFISLAGFDRTKAAARAAGFQSGLEENIMAHAEMLASIPCADGTSPDYF